MATLYEIFQPAIQPPFLQRLQANGQPGYGYEWGANFGHVKDQLMEWTKQSILARFPTYAPLDALGLIGNERKIIQGVHESTASYISRLINAWGAWSIGGSYWGLLAELNGAGYSNAYIAATNGNIYGPSSGVVPPDPINGLPGTPPSFFTLSPWYASSGSQTIYPPWLFSPSNGQGQPGNIDGSPPTYDPQYPTVNGPPDIQGAFWTRFVVIFYPALGTFTNPPTSTSSPTFNEIAVISKIIETWKPARSICLGLVEIKAPISGTERSTWGFPLLVTSHVPVSCWISNAIISGDVPASGALDPTHPQSAQSWLPSTAITNAGGSTYMFTIPSEYYLSNHTSSGGFLFSSPASSGTTGHTEPTWPSSLGNTVNDNGITWTACASLRAFGEVTTNTVFQVVPNA